VERKVSAAVRGVRVPFSPCFQPSIAVLISPSQISELVPPGEADLHQYPLFAEPTSTLSQESGLLGEFLKGGSWLTISPSIPTLKLSSTKAGKGSQLSDHTSPATKRRRFK
jgi:hypothetical protein